MMVVVINESGIAGGSACGKLVNANSSRNHEKNLPLGAMVPLLAFIRAASSVRIVGVGLLALSSSSAASVLRYDSALLLQMPFKRSSAAATGLIFCCVGTRYVWIGK